MAVGGKPGTKRLFHTSLVLHMAGAFALPISMRGSWVLSRNQAVEMQRLCDLFGQGLHREPLPDPSRTGYAFHTSPGTIIHGATTGIIPNSEIKMAGRHPLLGHKRLGTLASQAAAKQLPI